MRTISTILLLVLTLCGVSCSTTNQPEPALSSQDAYEQLTNTKLFAFGGIGYVGRTSPGELAFCTLAKSSDALDRFKAAASDGNPAARLYALCGIRLLDRKSFDNYAASLLATNPEVVTMSGCMVHHQQANTIIKNIADGVYDSYFPKVKRRTK